MQKSEIGSEYNKKIIILPKKIKKSLDKESDL